MVMKKLKKNNSNSKSNLFKRLLITSLIVFTLLIGVIATATYLTINDIIDAKENKKQKLIKNRLLKEGEVKSIKNNTLFLEDGKKIKLPLNLEKVFNDTDIKNESEPKITIKEYYDRIIIEEETEIDPESVLNRVSDNSNSSTIKLDNDFTSEKTNVKEINDSLVNETIVNETIDNFLEKCKQNKSKLCKKNREELKEMIEGKLNLNESKFYRIKKLKLSKIQNLDFDKMMKEKNLLKDPNSIYIPENLIKENWNKDNGNLTVDYTTILIPNLEIYQNSFYDGIFINGFTYGYELATEESFKWETLGTTIVDLTLGAYMGAGAGLRLPFKIQVSMPSVLKKGDKFNTTIMIEPIDLDERDYLDSGISSLQAFDGKELVLKLGAEVYLKTFFFGEKVDAFSVGKIIDNSRDFKPPMFNDKVSLGQIEFRGFDTGLFYGSPATYVEGNVGIGVDIEGDKYTMKVKSKNVISNPTELIFDDSFNKTFEGVAKLHSEETLSQEYDNFGYEFYNAKYYPKLDLVLRTNIAAVVNTGTTIGTVEVETPWVEIYSYNIPHPNIPLKIHSGTKNSIECMEGKVYQSEKMSLKDMLDLYKKAVEEKNDVCSVMNKIPIGTRISKLQDAKINIKTFEDDFVGSIEVHKGEIVSRSCENKFKNPTLNIQVKDYNILLGAKNKFRNKDPNFYDILLEGVNTGDVIISPSNSNKLITKIGNFGLKIVSNFLY